MKKYLLAAIVILFTAAVSFAKNARFDGETYSITLDYNETVSPGDAVFIRLHFEDIKLKKKTFAITAKAEIFIDGRSAGSSEFYYLSQKRNYAEFLTGIPLSSWAETGAYEIAVNYRIGTEKEKVFNLPLTVNKKEFPSGEIILNKKMDRISADTSPEKVAQSKKLNDIINTVNRENIFNLRKFILPVTSKRRTTDFAERIIYKYPAGKTSTTTHAGIDFGIPTGTQIVSDADGKVVLAENRISTGWTIVVEHLPGLYSMYYHLSQLKVKEGQMVKQGELLGLSGSTGFSTGPHLHWELRLNSVIVNPDFFLNDFAFNGQE